ncbi:hypothetical protein DN051_38205 [Streptomyces cadmiisoli]|uniref:Peptidoglycan binding-like domain-containing protein n=1 Tax=Streptomyces cadmiisoli TaxID=2184053 RepID=A0A2Z4J9P1_9ACTN|nr:hypothetical protein DN051_38205 [Streptomyces cadmiisoli]
MTVTHTYRRAAAGILAGVGLLSGLAFAAAQPASAADGWCNTHVARTKTFSGSVYTAYIPSYNTSTNCYMAIGAQGPAVAALQRSLDVCYGESLVIDGQFGDRTRAALVRAQRTEGIGDDGEYGTQTRDHLKWEYTRGGAWKCARL